MPGFPDKGHAITARHLASHRSGIRHYRDDFEAINTRHYHSVTESLEKFKDDSLMFVPDTDFGYSSYGYVLLSAVIEGAAGEDFLSYMRRHVFEPLRMFNTVADQANERAPNQSIFYDNGNCEPVFSLKYSAKTGMTAKIFFNRENFNMTEK